MRRCLYSLAFLFVIAGTADAQIQSGSISGTTTDEQAAVLPGVTLTLHGVDVTQTFATDATGQYRFLNLAPGPYTVTAEFQGFATIVREHVMVEVGKNIELALQMKIAALAETITVEGGSPLIDTKQTSTSTNITSDELAKIPTSRDPFAIMRSVPGVLVNRVNVGGNETGQQSNFASKGTRPQDAVWTLDGIVITDQASPRLLPRSVYPSDGRHCATRRQCIPWSRPETSGSAESSSCLCSSGCNFCAPPSDCRTAC